MILTALFLWVAWCQRGSCILLAASCGCWFGYDKNTFYRSLDRIRMSVKTPGFCCWGFGHVAADTTHRGAELSPVRKKHVCAYISCHPANSLDFLIPAAVTVYKPWAQYFVNFGWILDDLVSGGETGSQLQSQQQKEWEQRLWHPTSHN